MMIGIETYGAVLGIDAAWTLTQPSGLAVASHRGGRWRIIACASSYQRFMNLADDRVPSDAKSLGSAPDPVALLSAASTLVGAPIDLVAIDMPLSAEAITGRRVSDNAVSSAYGSRKAGTHTPSAIRPGPISDLLRQQFADAGYPLCTTSIAVPGLIEVYPHPALIELANAPERLRYKLQRAGKYWPTLPVRDRRKLLLLEWAAIVALLATQMDGVVDALRIPDVDAPLSDLKAFEDMLDAAVCCWVGIEALEGRAVPFGDLTSTIWVPAAVRAHG